MGIRGVGGHVGKVPGGAGFGRTGVAPEEAHGRAPGAGGGGIEEDGPPRGGNVRAGQNALLRGPGNGLCKRGIEGYGLQGLGLRGPGGPPEEGEDLPLGAQGIGREGVLGGSGGNAPLHGPGDGRGIVQPLVHVGESGGAACQQGQGQEESGQRLFHMRAPRFVSKFGPKRLKLYCKIFSPPLQAQTTICMLHLCYRHKTC